MICEFRCLISCLFFACILFVDAFTGPDVDKTLSCHVRDKFSSGTINMFYLCFIGWHGISFFVCIMHFLTLANTELAFQSLCFRFSTVLASISASILKLSNLGWLLFIWHSSDSWVMRLRPGITATAWRLGEMVGN